MTPLLIAIGFTICGIIAGLYGIAQTVLTEDEREREEQD